MMNFFKSVPVFATLSLALILGACVNPLDEETAKRVSAPAQLIERSIPAGDYAIKAFERMHETVAPARIYIEGDGTGFTVVDYSPTPSNPLGLHLAAYDNAVNVGYLARPCQYTDSANAPGACDPVTWKDLRFSPEILAVYQQALDNIKRKYSITTFQLVGFDGGATIAALLAASRDDVVSLRTVAGILDHKEFTTYHQQAALELGLNPPDFSNRLALIPQVHFIGGQDERVPPSVLHSYLQSLPTTDCVQYQMIQEAEHFDGWVNIWPELLRTQPVCAIPARPDFFEELEATQPERIFRPRMKPGKK